MTSGDVLVHLKFILENPGGVARLIYLGFNPGVKNMKISRFGHNDLNISPPLPPKPGSVWIGVRSRKLRSVTAPPLPTSRNCPTPSLPL